MEQTLTPEFIDAHARRSRRRRRALRIALASTAVLAVLALWSCWIFRYPLFRGNLAVVDPGRVIRSAQPTGQLPDWIKTYGLHSILNLRGGKKSDWWYAAEVEAARSGDVAFYDFPINATRRPSRKELLVIIDTLQSCQYPLLIHCKSGADRTGLASALYLMVRKDVPPEQAENAFTLTHAHIPLFGPEHLHEPLREYAGWLAAHKMTHTPDRFRDWVKNEYQSPDGHNDPPPLQPGPRVRHH